MRRFTESPSHPDVRPPNDLRISCKRLARHALTYVPLPAIGGWRSTELCPDALVGCMRGLGNSCAQYILIYILGHG